MLKKMEKIIRDVVESDEITISLQEDLIEDIGLDSLQLINYILALEEEFDIEIDVEEFDFTSNTTVEMFIKMIKDKMDEK